MNEEELFGDVEEGGWDLLMDPSVSEERFIPEVRFASNPGELACLDLSRDLLRAVQLTKPSGEVLTAVLETCMKAVNALVDLKSLQEAECLKELERASKTCCSCEEIFDSESLLLQLIELETCGHRICCDCAPRLIANKELVCPFKYCNSALLPTDVKACLSEELHEKWVENQLIEACENIQRCPNCNVLVEVISDEKGELNSRRVRCACDATFCVRCLASPFHEGLNCEEFQATWPCRICSKRIESIGTDRQQTVVCDSLACRAVFQQICNLQLPCGHLCPGVQGESVCDVPCLICTPELSPDDTCSVCLEALASGPLVKLGCSHLFHFQCLKQKFRTEVQSMVRVNLNFAQCPLCKSDICGHPLFQPEQDHARSLRKHAERILHLERAKLSREENSKVRDEAFSLYLCYKCEKPYFGGLRNCEQGLADQEDQPRESYLCPSCTCIELQIHECPVHGCDAPMVFKCRFCCSQASFFCWGTTHFCTDCHARQVAGERLNHAPAHSFPLCQGKLSCPLGLDHPPNGPSSPPFVLGCSLCRLESA